MNQLSSSVPTLLIKASNLDIKTQLCFFLQDFSLLFLNKSRLKYNTMDSDFHIIGKISNYKK